MLINKAKGIKVSLETSSLRELKGYVKDLRKTLSEYKYKNKIDEVTEYQIDKLCYKIDNTDISDLKYKEIEKYIDSLILILDFIFMEM
ncbi:TPA: hypothetical protein ACSRFK_002510 [Clostridioides difficile]|uniref:hypothetical protein n=1 Tax=Clostridioides difficile TaxID=1496 RepID=UPI00097FDF2B|nr:hypothetical protein [Clostridioides difficile]MDV9929205.1 hypothetical protein [Clostridioides difficile]SJO66914.1 Uncharacterised protein [Clostridioides difficile]SJS81110.1 Uncharacterised protein [Clostridioides difficile]HBE8644610.1 hypothetical protein [Clostridioides difficile]HBF2152137.1 hypothetical protein [Clostridioides difficile]